VAMDVPFNISWLERNRVKFYKGPNCDVLSWMPMDVYREGDHLVANIDLPGGDPGRSTSTWRATRSRCAPSAASAARTPSGCRRSARRAVACGTDHG
jgi:hypothetical protein